MAFLAVLFLIYGLRTLQRQVTVAELDETGLHTHVAALSTLDRAVRWQSLQDMQLKYFSTRRDRGEGWMQLVLKGASGTVRVDSNLDGFEDIIRRTYAAAQARGLNLNQATSENLKSLGIGAALEADPW